MEKDRVDQQIKKVKKDKETPKFLKMQKNEQNYMLEYFSHQAQMQELFEDYKLTLISEADYIHELWNNFENNRCPILFSIILLDKYKITLEGRNNWADLKIRINGVEFNRSDPCQISAILQNDTESEITKHSTDGNRLLNIVFINTLTEIIKIRFRSEYSDNEILMSRIHSVRYERITLVLKC